MMSKIKIGIIALILFCIIMVVSAQYMAKDFECTSYSAGDPICGFTEIDLTCGNGKKPIVRCVTCEDIPPSECTNEISGCKKCIIPCARACGMSTTCLETGGQTCDECCNDMCNVLDFDSFGSNGKDVCKKACTGICNANTEFCNIVRLLDILMIGVGVIFITINAVRWIMSDSDSERREAKIGIVHVLFGLTIIMVASGLVSLFYVGSIFCG